MKPQVFSTVANLYMYSSASYKLVILHRFIHGVEYCMSRHNIIEKGCVYVWHASPSSGLVFVCRDLISQTMKEEGKWPGIHCLYMSNSHIKS